ncbi:MAG: tetratricopeptide repeat protein [Methylococcaceae bacterium]|nr:tetratricopeptide repeat protein [Methylococcaceae bacterium]
MLLTVGRVDLAENDIQSILKQNPKDAEALAQQSVLALTQNRKEEAFTLAEQAIASNPKSASAYTALSYAEQGRFELDKALQAATQAAKLAPHDAMVWARKAELELALGLTSDSEETVQQAEKLDAELERTQTVIGFYHLQQMEADDAKVAFEKALKLDSTSPLARLGLGLAKIRNGDLEQGRQDLEIAATLDPNNSLIRSYLGKAYYEENRNPLAEDQFRLAKERDPKDPTPYFYDAIKKQTENNPIEALQDLQKSIELNENRATYRSKLALDSDLAARSASLSRIYNNLGFGQVALVEGWKSVNTDPTDYSAHRLLADSYSARPSFEIARVSELLQSQLLQPINMTPVQPQLGEKNLLTLQGSGPNSLSFNEFNPIFTRNRFTLQTSGLAGSNDTYSDEVVHSGLWRKLSYSFGQYHYESGGFRPNNDANADLVNGFIQTALTPNFSIQAEIRHKKSERGDIDLNADGTFDKNFRIGSDKTTYRAGMHYSIAENSDLIASYIHTDGQGSSIISDPNDFSDSPEPIQLPSFNINGNQGEIQHLFRSNYLSNISGFGFAQTTLSPIDFPQIKNATSHANGYSYNYIHYPHDVDWTLGLSIDSLEQTENTPDFTPKRFNRINPKLGMLWKTKTGSTLRGALFRTSKRSLITNQTIEPTQVAGFNQFYDDDTSTDVWLYGVALDQKFNSHVYGGLEIVARNLNTPINITDDDGNIIGNKREWHEQNYRAYLNWNITSRLAANVSFHLEKFEGDGRSSVAHFSPFIYNNL